MKHITYPTVGTCSKFIELEADDNRIITDLNVIGGCNGNLKGIGILVKGMSLAEAKAKLRGITCGAKSTSCPDQISYAIEELEKVY